MCNILWCMFKILRCIFNILWCMCNILWCMFNILWCIFYNLVMYILYSCDVCSISCDVWCEMYYVLIHLQAPILKSRCIVWPPLNRNGCSSYFVNNLDNVSIFLDSGNPSYWPIRDCENIYPNIIQYCTCWRHCFWFDQENLNDAKQEISVGEEQIKNTLYISNLIWKEG